MAVSALSEAPMGLLASQSATVSSMRLAMILSSATILSWSPAIVKQGRDGQRRKEARVRRDELTELILNRSVLPCENLVEGAPFSLDLVDVEPVRRELVPLALERLLPAAEDGDLGRPFGDLALEVLDERDKGDGGGGGGALDRVVLEVVARLEDGGVRLLHRGAELAAKAAENVALPGVVLGVDLALDLLVVDDGDSKRPGRLRVVERGASLADLEEELLPRGERLAEALVDVLGLEIPQRLELEPLVDVGRDLTELVLDESEGAFERAVGEGAELRESEVSFL